MSLVASYFFWAGLACAAAPVIIHLLNRRRFRVVHWAAMDFLRQALQRNRRIMQLRDLILLLLRTAAVALFGLALAQPYFESHTDQQYDRTRPLHAILIVDNSLSMGYEETSGFPLLSQAKQRAEEFIKELPPGSRITIAPLCGIPGSFSLDPYPSADTAIAALQQIEVVDRPSRLAEASNLAKAASEFEPGFSKRVVLFSDQQAEDWNRLLRGENLKNFSEMQVVDVSASDPTNSWISDFRLEVGIADADLPAVFTVRIRHEGAAPRKDARVSLWVAGKEVDSQTLDLEPGSGGEQEVIFKHAFSDLDPRAGEIQHVPVMVKLSSDALDRLPADNERYLVVPVAASVSIVFVDQWGAAGEKPTSLRFGETYPLRRWLDALIGGNRRNVAHITIDELSQELLADARLVAIAGVESPGDKVELLRQYVQQGGQLLIAAGADFDPRAWQNAAWLDGNGILPAPLKPHIVGQLPDAGKGKPEWFELKYDAAMKADSLFRIGGETDENLGALYNAPLFFQAVAVDEDDPDWVKKLRRHQEQSLAENLEQIAELQRRLDAFAALEAKGELNDQQRAEQAADRDRMQILRPQWLGWSELNSAEAQVPQDPAAREAFIRDLARKSDPKFLARFTNHLPFLVRRQIGRGEVLLSTSGIYPLWNTMAGHDTVFLWHRIMRSMLDKTLPVRQFDTQERIDIPLPSRMITHGLAFELRRPAPANSSSAPPPELLRPGYLGSQQRALTIHNALHQGIYEIVAYRAEPAASADSRLAREIQWQAPLAVNIEAPSEDETGKGSESSLAPMTREAFDQRIAGQEVPIKWVGADDKISLAGATIRGQDMWLYFAFAVLVLLLVEIAILAWPAATATAVASSETAAASPHTRAA